MKNRSTLVLLAGIVVLGAFIVVQETWRAKVPSREYRRVRLFDLDAATLVSLQFNQSNSVVRCVKETGVWMAGGGDQAMGRADVALVLRLVAGLNSMGKGTTITAEQLQTRGFDAVEYGFGQPTLKITAVDNQGRHEWLVGRKTPLGDMVYVKEADGDSLYTVSDKLLSVAPSDPGALRDRTLFAGEMAGVRRVEIRGDSGFVQMLKDAQAGWQIQQPVSAPADPAEVDRYIEQLYRLHIEDFVADNVSDFSIYGLQGETCQISLGGVDGASRMLMIGDEVADKAGHVYARRADDTSVFALKSDVLDLLNVESDRFRDASVLSIPAKEISSASIRHGDDALDLQMEENGRWKVTAPVTWAADADVVAELVKTWNEAVIIDYNVDAAAGAVDWVFEFGSARLGETNRIEVLFNSGEKDGLLIRRAGEPTVYRINLAALDDRMADPLAYKGRSIWELDRNTIQKVSIESADGTQTIERRPDGAFMPVSTNGSVQVDLDTAEKLLNRLSVLKASEYVTYNPRELGIYGLSDPSLELHIELVGTNELGRVLLVGRETPEGFYSMVKGRDVIFYLDKVLVGAMSQNLFEQPESVMTETK